MLDPHEAHIRPAIADGRHRLAFELIRAAYEARLYQYVHRMVRDTPLAEDVMQEALIQIFLGLGTVREGTSVRAWVTAVVMHQALDELRKRNRRASVVVALDDDDAAGDAADPRAGAGRSLEERDELRQLERCLDRLPPKVRAAVILRFGQDLTFEEVAELLGERQDAVRMRVARALVRLRKLLDRSARAA